MGQDLPDIWMQMRLTELNPKWLVKDGQRFGLIFKCPCCQDVWLSCKSIHMRGFDQLNMFARVVGEAVVLPCRYDKSWSIEGDSFENLTISPAIDASMFCHWHGFITDGEISEFTAADASTSLGRDPFIDKVFHRSL
jgi:hypothetical protein